MMKNQEKNKGYKTRRSYDEAFKASAVRLLESGRSAVDVSRSLGVNENLLRKWKSQTQGMQEKKEADSEKDHLRRYIKQLETERDILKKALSIFSRQT